MVRYTLGNLQYKNKIAYNEHIIKELIGNNHFKALYEAQRGILADENKKNYDIAHEFLIDKMWEKISPHLDDLINMSNERASIYGKSLDYSMIGKHNQIRRDLSYYKQYGQLDTALIESYLYLHPESTISVWSADNPPPDIIKRIFSENTSGGRIGIIIAAIIAVLAGVLIIPVLVILGYLLYRTAVLPANRRWSLGKILKNAALWPLNLRGIAAY